MNPHLFREANKTFVAPTDLDESQCLSIAAYCGTVQGGSLDGCAIVVTAWTPTAQELAAIAQGNPIFLSFIGGLPPHYPSMTFQEATHPA